MRQSGSKERGDSYDRLKIRSNNTSLKTTQKYLNIENLSPVNTGVYFADQDNNKKDLGYNGPLSP